LVIFRYTATQFRPISGRAHAPRKAITGFFSARTFLVPTVLAGTLLAGTTAIAPIPALAAQVAEGTETAAEVGPIDITSVYGAYLSGRHALESQDTGAASRFFDMVLAVDPANISLIRRAFLLRLEDGRFAAAMELAPQLTAEDGSDAPFARLALIVDSIKRADYSGALSMIDALPESRLNQVLSPLLGAWTALGAGDSAEAERRLDVLADQDGFQAFHALHKAMLLEAAGRKAEATTAYATLLRSQERQSQRVVLLAARQQARAGHLDTALAMVEQFAPQESDLIALKGHLERIHAAATAPTTGQTGSDPSKPGPERGVAEAFFDLASALQRDRGSETAMVFARLATELSPGFDLAILLAAEIQDDRKRPAAALELSETIGVESPFRTMATLRTASSLEDLDRPEEAVAALEALAAARPDLASPLVRLGDLERAREGWDASIAAYDRALERLSKMGREDWAVSYTRGIALERSKRWAEAETAFKKALELRPEQPFVLNYLGYSWVDRGENLDEALTMIERAVELRPRDGYIVDSLGWAYYRLGEFENAVRYLEQAVELKPTDPTINDHLGDAYWQVGRTREARFQWTRSLTFKPDAELAAKIEAKLADGMPEDVKAEPAQTTAPNKG
jgi:tetratricopeptide (TPR) repeat protein